MMYARTASSCEANQMVKRVGRKLLLAPPAREPLNHDMQLIIKLLAPPAAEHLKWLRWEHL